MMMLTLTLVGGPTVLIEANGFRLVTDPTFDAPGEYRLSYVTLTKTSGPALSADVIGPVDAVLVSHDQQFRPGRSRVRREGVAHLHHRGRCRPARQRRRRTKTVGREAIDQCRRSETDDHRDPRTPRPAGIEPMSGDVIGFVLTFEDVSMPPIYITGDTVWYNGVAEVARRFRAGVVLLFAGAAQTRGPFHLTMDTNDAIETAHAFPDAVIVPVHRDGWAHLTQSSADLENAFNALGLRSRLQMLKPGIATPIDLAK